MTTSAPAREEGGADAAPDAFAAAGDDDGLPDMSSGLFMLELLAKEIGSEPPRHRAHRGDSQDLTRLMKSTTRSTLQLMLEGRHLLLSSVFLLGVLCASVVDPSQSPIRCATSSR